MPDLPHLDWLIRWATEADAPAHRLKAAARELIDAEEKLSCPPDPRKLRTLHRAVRLLASGADLKSSGLPKSTYNRLRALARDSQATPSVEREFARWVSSPVPEDHE